MPELTDFDRELAALEAGLRQLEAEYNMFFAGRLPRPPVETRKHVDGLVRRLDRQHIPNTAGRFRFGTLQARYAAFVDLWERGLRAREEGRAGPFAHVKKPATPDEPRDRVVHVAAFSNPSREMDKLQDLYDRLSDARRAAGGEAVPFHRFAELVKQQVREFRHRGSREVAFRIAVKDGKVSFTARGLKGNRSKGSGS